MKKRKIIFTIIGIIIVVLLVIPFINAKKTEKPDYVTSEVKKTDILVEITATGTLNPLLSVEVGTQVSGIVSKLYADFNDIVKQGQVIATIDTTNLNISIIEAEANLLKAQAQLYQQKQEYLRYVELLDKKAIAQSEFDVIKSNYLVSESNLKSAQANLKKSKTNIGYATITAPISGLITNRAVNEGQTVAANFQAPILFTIANDLKKMQLQAKVDEADIGKVKIGQEVRFTVDAYPEIKFIGKVEQIRLQPTTSQNVVTYTVIIDAPNPDFKLLPGMNANISIVIEERKNVITVPLSAFEVKTENFKKVNNNDQFIYVLDSKNLLLQLKVEKGIDDGNSAEIVCNEIKLGANVIIGIKDAETKQVKSFLPSPPKQKNPMMRP